MKKMSLIYDPSANNKPANADTLFLNNEGFKQEQININNNESTLKLDISALLSQGEIEGTECVSLLIEQWRTVASICDTFRNFGTGVLDPTLGKMAMSIDKIDDDAAKSTELEKMLDLNKPGNNSKGAFLSPSTNATSPNPIYNIYSGYFQSFDFMCKDIARSEIGVELEDLLKFGISPWMLFFKPKENDATDPFDDHGLYGGHQGCIDPAHSVFGSNWIIVEDDEIYDFVKKHKGYENYSDKQIHDLLTTLEDTGCSYVATANAIFWHYRNQGELFEKKFGFPIKGKDGDLNYKKLVIDFYLNNKCTIYLDEPHGLEAFKEYFYSFPDEFITRFSDYCVVDENGNIIGDKEIIFEYVYNDLIYAGETAFHTQNDNIYDHSFYNKVSHYSKEKNLGLELEHYVGAEVTEEKIRETLNNGDIFEIRPVKFNLEFEDGSVYNLGQKVSSHSMIVTGIAPDGRYIVSTWGTKLYFNPKDCESIRGFAIKYKPGKTIKMNVSIMGEDGTPSVAAKLSGDIKHKKFRSGNARVTKASDFDVPLE